MKKIFLTFLFFCLLQVACFSKEIENEMSVYFSPSTNNWSLEAVYEDSIILTKKLMEGSGEYSLYYYPDGSLAFALSTGDEFIKDNNLIIIDNNLLKYYKLIFNGEIFEQILLSENEIKNIFPNAELFMLSTLDDDCKTWLHKPILEKKSILLVNDTDNFYHNLTCKYKNVQDEKFKGLITFNRYGIFRFKHFGKRDGYLVFYIR